MPERIEPTSANRTVPARSSATWPHPSANGAMAVVPATRAKAPRTWKNRSVSYSDIGADLKDRSGWNRARIEVRGALALHARESVVDRLRVAVQAAGDLLVGAAVQIQRQDRALELGKRTRQAADQAVQFL